MSYDRHNPYSARLKECIKLNKEGSFGETYHLVLESTLPYKVGDSVAVLPRHDPLLVEKTVHFMRSSKSASVVDPKTGKESALFEQLQARSNITRVPISLVQKVAESLPSGDQQTLLLSLLQPQSKQALESYLNTFELWDFLETHSEHQLTAQEIVSLLPPILPRFYSIASSPYAYNNEIHLMVAMADFTTRGITRHGVGTHYLCRLASEEIPIYIQSAPHFTLKEESVPLIMVGGGTGIAPFKGFVEELLVKNSQKKSWLFFGEKNRAFDFFYESFWEKAASTMPFRLTTAFSRDQSDKYYVQHALLEHSAEIYHYLEQERASFYICGDAHYMAKGVEESLLAIIEKEGNHSPLAAKDYLKCLRKEKRYLKDVY
jgi:sulfite reductase (NADPH) flavoprotein alpha-component